MDEYGLNKVLIVDDDSNLLAALNRQLRGKYDVTTAGSGELGLTTLEKNGPFAVIMSDMRMPGMNGIQFLSRAQEMFPNSVRMMLTGNADIETAMHAVNEGNIFRFLVKPCQRETLYWAMDAGIRQYRLVTAERILLEKTLMGSIQILADILALVNPVAFGRANRLKEYAAQLVNNLNVEDTWQFEAAALLSQIGCVALPEDILNKVYSGEELTEEEHEMYAKHPELAGQLLSLIPRLGIVGKMIANQDKEFYEMGVSAEEIVNHREILGAQILKICTEFDTYIFAGEQRVNAMARLKTKPKRYHPAILRAAQRFEVITVEQREIEMSIRELTDSMVLAADVVTGKGILIAPRGQKISLSMRIKLQNYAQRNQIPKRIKVVLPTGSQALEATSTNTGVKAF